MRFWKPKSRSNGVLQSRYQGDKWGESRPTTFPIQGSTSPQARRSTSAIFPSRSASRGRIPRRLFLRLRKNMTRPQSSICGAFDKIASTSGNPARISPSANCQTGNRTAFCLVSRHPTSCPFLNLSKTLVLEIRRLRAASSAEIWPPSSCLAASRTDKPLAKARSKALSG